MTSPGGLLSFRYFPGGVLVSGGLAAFILYGATLMVCDPDVMSPKGIIWTVGQVLGGVYFVYASTLLWPVSCRYTLTPTHLIATHDYRRTRVEVAWNTIVRVTKKPRPPFGLGR